MMRKILIRLIVLLVIVGSMGYYYMNAVNTTEVSLYYGEARPITADVFTKVPGLIEEVLIEEGDLVEEGDTIVRMESDEAQLRVEKAELAAALADEALGKATGAARDQELAIQENSIGQLDQERIILESSIASLRKAYEQNRLNLSSLEKAYELQKKTYEDRLVLNEAGEETAFNLSTSELAMTSASNNLETAKLDGVKIGNEIRGLEARIQGLNLQIDSAKEVLSMLEEGYGDHDRKSADISGQMARVDLSLAATSLKNHEVKTHMPGVVESVNFDKGEYVGAGAAVATVMIPDRLTLDLYVSEKDLLGLENGMAMTMTLVAEPEIVVSGEVTHIATEAMFTPVNTVMAEDRERLVYLVEVTITDISKVKPGMLLSVDLTGLE